MRLRAGGVAAAELDICKAAEVFVKLGKLGSGGQRAGHFPAFQLRQLRRIP